MIILAGGLGTRLAEETAVRPKPMVEIGGRPILWHIMSHAYHSGVRDFVVALGYKGEQIKQFFLNYRHARGNLLIDQRTGAIATSGEALEQWAVNLVETGDRTDTGGRIRQCAAHVPDGCFIATYGDGLADINIAALIDYHRSHGKLATISAVRPPARFGGMVFDGNKVVEFTEKPQTGEGWINGGYFVIEKRAMEYVDGDNVIWERGPLERLARDGELMAFRHEGFFQPMDTLRERAVLEELWSRGVAPWRNW